MVNDLKSEFDKYFKEHIEPINRNMLEQENSRHKLYLEKHFDKYDVLGERHDSYISQLINLEGVIFGAIVIFSDHEQVSTWLIASVCLILISLIFGILRQSITVSASYQTQEWNYSQEIKNNWFTRELWNDKTVQEEKKLMEPHLNERENAYKKIPEHKLLKLLHLNADRIESIFIVSFVIALSLLIIHLSNKAPLLLNSIQPS